MFLLHGFMHVKTRFRVDMVLEKAMIILSTQIRCSKPDPKIGIKGKDHGVLSHDCHNDDVMSHVVKGLTVLETETI